MGAPAGIRDAAYYQRLLDALYGQLEGLDTTGYAWDLSDRWKQGRQADSWGGHLECWIDIGGTVTRRPGSYLHACRLVAAMRYLADSSSQSQARLHAAVRDATESLLSTPLPDGARVIDVEQVELVGVIAGGWVEAHISFSLHLPR